jgi:cytochrome c-type biogenesis protein CcmH/NrfG
MLVKTHYERALKLSGGTSAELYIAYAEAVALQAQDKEAFRGLLDKALAQDPDSEPRERLATLIA